MQVTSSTAAATRAVFFATNPKHDFIIQVLTASAAGIRVLSGHPIVVNGVATADTTGLTVPVDGSIRLSGNQAWLIGTDTDTTAATYEIMAIESDRR